MQQEEFNPDIINDKYESNPDNEYVADSAHNSGKEGALSSLKKFFSDKRLRMFFGICFSLIGFYLFLSFFSFLRTGAEDQSLILQHNSFELAENSITTKNLMGSFGAEISEKFINKGIGLSSFIFAIWLMIVGIRLFGAKQIKLFSVTVVSFILIGLVSLLLGLISLNSDSFILYGGYLGRYVSGYLVALLGYTGTFLLYVILLAAIVLIILNKIIRFAASVSRIFSQFRKKKETEKISEIEPECGTQFSFTEFNENVSDKNEIEPVDETIIKDSPLVPIENNPSTETEDSTINDSEPEITTTITKAAPIVKASEKLQLFDPTDSLPRFKFPSTDLLKNITMKENNVDKSEQEENKKRITKALQNYGITIKSIEVCVGPTITLFEIIPADGIKIAKIKSLENDIALSLAALGIRIIAPIPGKGTIGIEVPNRDPQTVSMRSVLESKAYQECKYDLPMAMGCTISNKVFIADLCKMPHLLVAGATGQGKSVGLNAIITSLIYRKHPSELKFVLFDPKMVEFSLYSKLEHHYLAKLPGEEDAIITDSSKAIATLNSLTVLMDHRYELLKNAHVRNIKEYNAKFSNRLLNPEKGHDFMPYIVVIIDEFADLIMMAGKEVETPIARIAQKARAVGIHMILATQRPSTTVVTGNIKANFPARIAFKVSQMVDSRTILDCSGGQQLIGRGDMLFLANGEMHRVQCAFISTEEAESICDYIGDQIGYAEAYELPEYIVPNEIDSGGFSSISDRDSLFEEAAAFIVTGQTASTSSLQRRYSIGYNRAGKIMDQLESAGIVGPAQGGKPRQVLVDSIQLSQMLGN